MKVFCGGEWVSGYQQGGRSGVLNCEVFLGFLSISKQQRRDSSEESASDGNLSLETGVHNTFREFKVVAKWYNPHRVISIHSHEFVAHRHEIPNSRYGTTVPMVSNQGLPLKSSPQWDAAWNYCSPT